MRIGLFDSYFNGFGSMSVADETASEKPQDIEWVRNEYLPITFYTDSCMKYALDAPIMTKNIGVLVEPRCLRPEAYAMSREVSDKMSYILTYDRKFLNNFPVGLGTSKMWYPFGGARIFHHPRTEFVDYKDEFVSLITTDKNRTEGHALRRKIAESGIIPKDHIYGRGSSNPMIDKHPALDRYMFSVVVESCIIDDYFTEKLIDCFTAHTVPIYYGSPEVMTRYFDSRGIILFRTLDDLRQIIPMLSLDMYRVMSPFVRDNYQLSIKYRVAEDWIYKNYPGMFHE